MKTPETLLSITLCSTTLFGQSNCYCLDYNDRLVKPDTLFHFGDKSIAICDGCFENGLVSEFSIKLCNDSSLDKFYSATLEYNYEVVKDTLYLEDYRLLWNFETYKVEKTVWAIEKFWIENKEIYFNRVVVYEADDDLKIDNEFITESEPEIKTDWSDNPKTSLVDFSSFTYWPRD